MPDFISIKPTRKIMIFIGSIAIAAAICVGTITHDQQRGIDTYFKVVNYLSQPIFNWMEHRVDKALEIINR